MPKCEGKTEVYSRVTGYMQPVHKWNAGKQEEFKDRKNYHPTGGTKEYDTIAEDKHESPV